MWDRDEVGDISSVWRVNGSGTNEYGSGSL